MLDLEFSDSNLIQLSKLTEVDNFFSWNVNICFNFRDNHYGNQTIYKFLPLTDL